MDNLTKEYPGTVILKGKHNHPISIMSYHRYHSLQHKEHNDTVPEFIQLLSTELTEQVFVPALKKILKHVDEATEIRLVKAVHTSGLFAGIKAATQRVAKRLIQCSPGTVIKVQPTALGCRKSLLSGKRKSNAGQPKDTKKPCKELSSHDDTSFGLKEKRKRNRKGKENPLTRDIEQRELIEQCVIIQQCVFDNES